MNGDLMFERYTDRARRSVVLAQSEARDLRHPDIDVDHLLLGLAAEGEGVAFRALDCAGVSAARIREEVALRWCQVAGAGIVRSGHLPFTAEAKRALEYAQRESIKLSCAYVGTEHLLLGLMKDCELRAGSPCAVILKASGGVTPETVRDAVMVLLRGYEQAEAGKAAEPGDPMAAILAQLDGIAHKVESLRRHLGVPE